MKKNILLKARHFWNLFLKGYYVICIKTCVKLSLFESSMAMETKLRPAFTLFEKEYLRELITPHINTLESKKTNSAFNKEKDVVWTKIAVQFNNCSRCVYASPKQLKKAWNNMKTRARDAKTILQQRKHTGGGPPISDMKPEDEGVLSILPTVLPTVKVVKDSDGAGDNDQDADDDSQYWIRKINRPSLTPHHQLPPPHNELNETDKDVQCFKTPSPIDVEVEITNSTITDHTYLANDMPNSSTQPKTRPNLNKTAREPTHTHSLDQIKRKIIENDLKYREQKFELEMAHIKKTQEMKENILMLEIQHKKRLSEMSEEEHKIKIAKLLRD